MDMLYSAFRWVLNSTLEGSAVVLIVLAVLGVFRHRLHLRVRHLLWIIVLVRLLLPVFPSSPVSIFQAGRLELAQFLPPIHPSRESADMRQAPGPVDYTGALQSQDNKQAVEPVPVEEASHLLLPAASVNEPGMAFKIGALLWSAGAAALLSAMAVRALRMNMRYKNLQPVSDPAMTAVVEECKQKLQINRRVKLVTGRQPAAGPHIYGLLRPHIYIPETLCRELSAAQLTHIVMHELAHFKRKDMLWNLLGGMALAVHWFNPLVWLAMKRMKADCELACDACALDALGEGQAIPYGMTIVDVLKSYASARDRSQALGFFGSDARHLLERRIRMIKAFKKGSYKLTAVSILVVLVIGLGTLTNAASPAGEGSPEKTSLKTEGLDEETIMFGPTLRDLLYNNLDKAVKKADFTFKVPYALPADYKLESVRLRAAATGDGKRHSVEINFSKWENNVQTDEFRLSAEYGAAGIDQAYEKIEKDENMWGPPLPLLQKEEVNIAGTKVWKVSVYKEKWKYPGLYYLWQDEGVQYQMGRFFSTKALEEAEALAESLIVSMQKPALPMGEQYVSESMFNVPVYDAGDLRRGMQDIGFAPKFPLQVLDQFQASSARITRKSNFTFSDNNPAQDTRLLLIEYTKQGDADVSRRFSFMQISDAGIFEELKDTGEASFQQIDGKKFTAAASRLELEGHEVYRTAPYKIDGAISSPQEADYVSFFWKDEEVCFQVQFLNKGYEAEQMNGIAAAFIREKTVIFK